jgi:hypothetical protein
MNIDIEKERQILKNKFRDNVELEKKLKLQLDILIAIEQKSCSDVELNSALKENFSVDESGSIKKQILTIRRDLVRRKLEVNKNADNIRTDMRNLTTIGNKQAIEEAEQRQAEEAEQKQAEDDVQKQAEKELLEMCAEEEKELLKSHAEEENEKKRRTKQSIQDRERAKAKKETDVLISAVVSAAAETNLIEAKEKTIHEMIGVSTKQKVLFDKMQTLRTCFDECIRGIFIRPYNMGMDDDTFEKILAEEVIGYMIASVDNATRSYRSARSRPRRASIAGGSLKKKRRRTKRKRKSKTYHKR